MRVHVVALSDSWILQRYANILAQELGWTVSKKSRSDVDINHYMPYLLFNEHPGTKCSAWFTHLEEAERRPDRPRSKVTRWYTAAETMDLRLTQAVKYKNILVQYGPTEVMPTPVNVKKFKPRPLVIGVSGRVYGSGRKGEQLVSQLMNHGEFEVVASGRGWPCPTTFYDRKDMATFFQGLDVFLVTSLVEGGPDTVLEALACGVPVVAPNDVGFCDEFQLFRYTKGNFNSMLAQLKMFNEWRLTFRAQVVSRTETGLAQAYLKAFQEHL